MRQVSLMTALCLGFHFGIGDLNFGFFLSLHLFLAG
jgi:hypothetical protein